MKRIALVCILICMMTLAIAHSAYAWDFSIGASGWYNWWEPAWYQGKWKIKYVGGYPPYTTLSEIQGPNFSMEGGLWGGPMLSIHFFDRWKLSTTFIYGSFSFKTSGQSEILIEEPSVGSSTQSNYNQYNRSINRLDSDTALSYTINDWTSLLIGCKVQGYSFSDQLNVQYPGITIDISAKYTTICFGPAFGIGLTFPLVDNFFFVSNINGIFLFGFEKAIVHSIVLEEANDPPLNGRDHYYAYGGTTQCSLAYVFPSIDTTLMLGFRYQILHYIQTSAAFLEYNGKSDQIFGVTLSAVYTFNNN